MAAKKIYDLAVKVGEYQSGGETKARYQNVGAIIQKEDGGKFITLARWFNPGGVQDFSGKGGESLLISMFPPKEVDGSQGGQQRAPAQAPAPQRAARPQDDDEIPF